MSWDLKKIIEKIKKMTQSLKRGMVLPKKEKIQPSPFNVNSYWRLTKHVLH